MRCEFVVAFSILLLFTLYTWVPRLVTMSRQLPDTIFNVLRDFSYFKRANIYTQVSGTKVFIYSVIGRNTSITTNLWKEFGVSAWIHSELNPESIACCFRMEDDIIIKLNYTNWVYYVKDVIFAVQYTCPIPKSMFYPRGITLTLNSTECSRDFSTYIKPVYSSRQVGNETIALCAKQIYGNLSASLAVTWLVYNRAMGVDKIVAFVNESDLSKNTYKVLKYYESQKFLKILKIEFPMQDVIPRDPLRNSNLSFSDEQILVYYCQDSLAGYSFIGGIDLDEFIMPQQGRNFKELMRHLMETYTNSAYYTFLVEYYIRNWGRQKSSEQLIPIEYIQRTDAMKDRVKNIVVRDRFEPGSINTHEVTARRGFSGIPVPTDVAVLKHYRACRDDWEFISDCIKGTGKFQRFTDDSLKKKLEQMIVKDNITLRDAILHTIKYLGVN